MQHHAVCRVWHLVWLCAVDALRDVCGSFAPLALWRAAGRLRNGTLVVSESYAPERTAWDVALAENFAGMQSSPTDEGQRWTWPQVGGQRNGPSSGLLQTPILVVLSLADHPDSVLPLLQPKTTPEGMWELLLKS